MLISFWAYKYTLELSTTNTSSPSEPLKVPLELIYIKAEPLVVRYKPSELSII